MTVGSDDDEEAVDVNRKRGRADSKYNLKKKEKDAKKRGRVLVEVHQTRYDFVYVIDAYNIFRFNHIHLN